MNAFFVLKFQNKKNSNFNKIKSEWNDSKFFSGKNRLMQLAIGKSSKTEIKKNLYKLGKALKNECVLLMTNRSVDDVKKYFNFEKSAEFAKAGTIASETISLKEGILENIPFSMEPRLKELKLPVKLNDRKIVLLGDFTICSKGEMLDATKAALLV